MQLLFLALLLPISTFPLLGSEEFERPLFELRFAVFFAIQSEW
jgi:hypothetical protein